jgi:hypothetical protein
LPEFQNGALGVQCRHIEAVLDRYGRGNGDAEGDNYARQERLAIQNESRVAPDQGRQAGPAVMLLKRSVSPDGRIDSLSVEFTAEVDGMAANEVAERAARLLALQTAIVRGFLDSAKNSNGTGLKAENNNGANGAALAEMVGIGGTDGKWGRRLFIGFQANGQSLLAALWQPDPACRGNPKRRVRQDGGADRGRCGSAGAEPRHHEASPDGRYVNIERMLPVQPPDLNGRNGR